MVGQEEGGLSRSLPPSSLWGSKAGESLRMETSFCQEVIQSGWGEFRAHLCIPDLGLRATLGVRGDTQGRGEF